MDNQCSVDVRVNPSQLRLQPIVNAQANTVFGYEILSKLDDSLVAESFFKSANSALIQDVFYQQVEFAGQADNNFYYFINIRTHDLSSMHIDPACFPHANIVIELQDPENITQLDSVGMSRLSINIRILQAAGLQVWIDDLQPSLLFVLNSCQINFDGIKIDKGAFWRLCSDIPQLTRFLSHCQYYSDKLLIEGVENKAHYNIATYCNVPYVQGYYWPEFVVSHSVGGVIH